MSPTYEQIAAEAMQLSPKERADLADKLWISVDTPEAVTAAWDEEIARRIDDFEAGRTKGVPAEEVFAKIRALIDSHGK